LWPHLLERHSNLLTQKPPPLAQLDGAWPSSAAGTGAFSKPSRYHPTCPVVAFRWRPGPLSRCNGRTRPNLLTPEPGELPSRPFAFGYGGSGRIFGPSSAPGFPPSPARSGGGLRPYSFPS
jgi:hypothetical protein